MTSSRDTVLQWLALAASRMWLSRWVREGAWGIATLLILCACYAVLSRVIVNAEIMVAIRPLLAVLAIAIVVCVALRVGIRPALAAAAAAVDAKSGMKDELLSARWFAAQTPADPFTELHLSRAAHQCQQLDAKQFFPVRIARGAVGIALVSILITGTMVVLPEPRRAISEAPLIIEGRRVEPNHDAPMSAAPLDEASVGSDAADVSAARNTVSLWKQLDALIDTVRSRPETQSLAEAVAARDARRAAQVIRATMEQQQTKNATVAAATPGDQMNDTMAKDILARLDSLMSAEEQPPVAKPRAVPESNGLTAALNRELRQDDAEDRAARREATPGEDAVNTSLRALSRTGADGRDAVHGEADRPEGAGRANMSGGAMGRRINASTSGAGEGDQPTDAQAAPPEGDAVLGARTQRLSVQLKSVAVAQSDASEGSHREDQSGTEDSLYAATRAQAARVGVAAGESTSRSDAEITLEAERTDLAYREAVKRYTLTRHRREPEPSRDSGNVRRNDPNP